MAFTTFTAFPDSGTTANLKAWAQGFSQCLDTVGNPRTADTGQTDFATFSATPSVGSFPIVEVRRFNDSLQASAPIFYRIEYGSVGNVNTCGIRLTVGTSTNGTGGITGNKTAVLEARAIASSTTLSANHLVSGTGSRVVAALFADGQTLSAGMHLGIERTKDSLGNDTTEGAIITMINGSTSNKHNQFLPFVGGVPPVDVLGTIGAISGNGTDGADVITCPNFPFRGSGLMNPGLNVEFYMNGSVNAGTIAPIERYGVSRNYYFIGNNTSFTGLLRGNAAWIANSTLAIRWE